MRLPLCFPRSLRRRGSGDTMPNCCRELCMVSPEPRDEVVRPQAIRPVKDGYLGRLPKDVVAQVGRIDRRA